MDAFNRLIIGLSVPTSNLVPFKTVFLKNLFNVYLSGKAEIKDVWSGVPGNKDPAVPRH